MYKIKKEVIYCVRLVQKNKLFTVGLNLILILGNVADAEL